jgi:hypothetical protein
VIKEWNAMMYYFKIKVFVSYISTYHKLKYKNKLKGIRYQQNNYIFLKIHQLKAAKRRNK